MRVEEFRTRTTRRELWLALALATTALAHAPALFGDFVWDDRILVLESPSVMRLAPPHRYFREPFFAVSPQGERPPYYRPLATLSLALDRALYGGHPAGFHATNLLVHLACTALVFALATRAGAGMRGAALAAALFGALPRGTEAVDWISGRTDLLAATAALLGLALHDPAAKDGHRRIGAAAAIFVGLLCKETALAGALGVLALEAAHLRATRRLERLPERLAPLAAAVLLWLVLRLAAGVGLSGTAEDPPGARLVHGLGALGAYAWMLCDALRPNLQIGLLGAVELRFVALGVAVFAGCAAALAFAWRARAPALPFAAGVLALAALLPALHLIPISTRVLAADRYLYLPAAALAIAVSALLARAPFVERRSARIVAAALLGAFVGTTAMRAALYADEIALFEETLAQAHPANALPAALLGEALLRRGDPTAALPLLEQARATDAAWSETRPSAGVADGILGNLAGCQTALGRHEDAAATLAELLRRSPDQPKHHYNLGIVLGRLGRRDAALKELDRALELLPGYPQAEAARRGLLAGDYSSSGEPSESESFSRR